MFLIDSIMLVTGLLLLLGIASSKLSARLGVPVLVLFLVVGMLAGSEGIGGIAFEDYRLAHGIGTIALAFILFDGGLGTSLSAVGVSWKPAAVLATFGVLVTAVLTGIAAKWILNVSWLEGLLLGSIVGSTDAAAVFGVLRTGGIGLPKRLASVLELESASNDPMAIFLTIGCIELLLENMSFGWELGGLFAAQMLVGAACGVVGGYVAAWMINRVELGAPGLYPVLVSSFCLLTFGIAAKFGGSGFLAVYLAGVILGNQEIVFQRGIRLFHDAVAWLSQILMFIVLGLLCFPSRLLDVAGKALLISAVLILVARPLAVLLSTRWFRFQWSEIVFMSWVGLKGAVPITLATFPLMLSTPEHNLQASLIFDVVFFIVVVSATVQGTSLSPVAKWLGLERPRPPAPPLTLEINSLKHVDGEIVEYDINADSRAVGSFVRDLTLPEGAVIALITRGEQIVAPQGRTQIMLGDHVILMMKSGLRSFVDHVFGSDHEARHLTPDTLEFPLRGSTTVNELEALYSIELQVDGGLTLAELIQSELLNLTPRVFDAITAGPLLLRVLRLDEQGRIELVGMSFRAKSQAIASEA